MIGIPSINLMCFVLCLIESIVRYIATDPPRAEIMSKVDSGILHLFLFALILSETVTMIDISDTRAKYIKKYLTILILPRASLCHFIASLVIGMTCMSLYPDKLHRMNSAKLQKLIPKVRVKCRRVV